MPFKFGNCPREEESSLARPAANVIDDVARRLASHRVVRFLKKPSRLVTATRVARFSAATARPNPLRLSSAIVNQTTIERPSSGAPVSVLITKFRRNLLFKTKTFKRIHYRDLKRDLIFNSLIFFLME